MSQCGLRAPVPQPHHRRVSSTSAPRQTPLHIHLPLYSPVTQPQPPPPCTKSPSCTTSLAICLSLNHNQLATLSPEQFNISFSSISTVSVSTFVSKVNLQTVTKRHNFPWSQSPGNCGTTGATMDTLLCRRKSLLIEEAKKVKRKSGRSQGKTRFM